MSKEEKPKDNKKNTKGKKKKIFLEFYYRNVTQQYFWLEGEVKGKVKKSLKKAFAVNYINRLRKRFGDDLLESKIVEANETYSLSIRIRMEPIIDKFIMPKF